jgi:hypothetical protein
MGQSIPELLLKIGIGYRNCGICFIASLFSLPLVFPIAIGIQSVFDSIHLPVYAAPFSAVAIGLAMLVMFVLHGMRLAAAMGVAGQMLESKPLLRASRAARGFIVGGVIMAACIFVPYFLLPWMSITAIPSLDRHMQNVVPILAYFVPPLACGLIIFPIAMHELKRFAAFFPVESGDHAIAEARDGIKRSGIALALGLLATAIFTFFPIHFILSSYYAIVEVTRAYDTVSTPFLILSIVSTCVLGILAIIASIQGLFRIAHGFETMRDVKKNGEITYWKED